MSSSPISPTDPRERLTEAWLAFVGNPQGDLEPLREQVTAMIYRLMLPRAQDRFFAGLVDHLVREATFLTLASFFPKNTRLHHATKARNRAEVTGELMRTLWLALQRVLWRTRTMVIAHGSEEPRDPAFEDLRRVTAEFTFRADL